MAFIKKVENFKCGNCGAEVQGSGYTNHCPACLWSKHVDVEPGDRQAECGGLMRPTDLYYRGGKWVITHRCESCGFTRQDKIRDTDDSEAVIDLQQALADKKMKRI